LQALRRRQASATAQGEGSRVTETADKPRISYGEMRWYEAFTKLIALDVGAKLTANGQVYKIEHWNPEPTHAFLQLRYKEGGQVKKRMVRRGDVLMLELKSVKWLTET
jgi:hypothetical protein